MKEIEYFVIEDGDCRGDRFTRKVRVSDKVLEDFFKKFKKLKGKRTNEAYDLFDDYLCEIKVGNVIENLMSALFVDSSKEEFDSFLKDLRKKGKHQVMTEESNIGIGVTKEKAYEALHELDDSESDDWC